MNSLKLLLPDGSFVLVPVDPLSTFLQLYTQLPSILHISAAEASTLAFYSENNKAYALQRRISQTQAAFVRVLVPRFDGILQVYVDGELRTRHFISLDYCPASEVYYQLLIFAALEKLQAGTLLTPTELYAPVVYLLALLSLADFVQDYRQKECPAAIYRFIKESQLRRIFLGAMDEFFAKTREQFIIYQKSFENAKNACILQLATLCRYTALLVPAVSIVCENNGDAVRQVDDKTTRCYLAVSYTHVQRLDNCSLELLDEEPLSRMVYIRCYADCISFEFANAMYWNFTVDCSESCFEECKQYIELVAALRR